MEINRVLIFGAGFLGTQCAEYFAGKAVLSQADITDFQAVRNEVEKIRPNVIVNTAAKTSTHALELPKNQELAYQVNVQGPAQLSRVARETGTVFVHLSTAMMFDGSDIPETATPRPTSYYALTKAWADAQLIPFMEDVSLVLRIHTPLSPKPHPKNLLTKMQQWSQLVDAQASVTVVDDLFSVMERLIEQDARGIYNVTNTGSISFFEIAELMQHYSLIGPEVTLEKVTSENFQAQVAQNGGAYQPFPILSTKKLEAAGIHMRPVKEAVEAVIKAYMV